MHRARLALVGPPLIAEGRPEYRSALNVSGLTQLGSRLAPQVQAGLGPEQRPRHA